MSSVVNETGECLLRTFTFLSCERATGTNVDELYNDIMTTFELQCVTFEKLEYILQIQIILQLADGEYLMKIQGFL